MLALSLHALALLLAAPQGDPPEEPWLPVHPLVHEFDFGGERLVAYAWDAEPATPSSFRADRVRLDFGEAGIAQGTALYLPCNEGEGDAPADVSPGARGVVARAASFAPGRFASGLEFASPGSSLTIERGSELFAGGEWTLELWLRPAAPLVSGTRQSIVRVPGVFELMRIGDDRCELRIEAETPATLNSKVRFDPAGWNHLAVSYGTRDLHQVRLVLNGALTRIMNPPALRAGTGSEAVPLYVGGGAESGESGSSPGSFLGRLDDLRVLARSVSTAELIERHAAGAQTGEHTLHLFFESGERTLRLWAGALAPATLDPERVRVHGVLEHVVATEHGLRWAEGHWERAEAPVRPLARTTHPTVFLGDHRVLVFGGETRDTHSGTMVNTNDTWLFDMQARTWTRSESEQVPPPSCHQAAAYSPDHDLVLYPGGFRLDEKPWFAYDCTWVYHVAEERWEERHPEGVKLPEISGCTVVYHPKLRRFVMIVDTRVFVYDPDADRWDQLAPPTFIFESGRIPKESAGFPGSSLMAAYDPYSGGILLYGGEAWLEGEHTFQSTTAVYHLETNTLWIREPTLAPAPRVRAGFARDERRGRYVMFGGVLGQHSQRMADLWTYDIKTNTWRLAEASNTPSPRGGFYDMAYDPELDRFALLCGRNATARFLDEAWLLHLDPAAEGRALFVFDLEGAAAGRRLRASWLQPGASTVGLRFQASSDGLTWSAWEADPAVALGPGARFLRVEVKLVRDPLVAPPELLELTFLPPGAADTSEVPAAVPAEARHAIFALP